MASIITLLIFVCTNIYGDNIGWTNWQEAIKGNPGTVNGKIIVSKNKEISISYKGEVFFAQTEGGNNYWLPAEPYLSASVQNPPPDPDIIGLIGGTSIVNTITFSEPVANPVMAILSLGTYDNAVQYKFNRAFTILSNAKGCWGDGPLTRLPGNILEGKEGHGAIQFPGTISSISWTVDTQENWHGFTIGIAASLIKESDKFRSEADGNFQSVISDKHGYQIVLDSQYGKGFQAIGRLGENSSHITEFKIDSKNGIAEMNFLVYGISTHIPVNDRIPPPTETTIKAYMQMLTPDDILAFYSDNILESITAMPDGPLPFQASSDEIPLLLWVSSYEPNPGGVINLSGRFKNNWDLTVKINDVEVPIADSTDNFITAQIPAEQEPGKVKVKIIRTLNGEELTSDQKDFEILPPGESPSSLITFFEEKVGSMIKAIFSSPYLDYIYGTWHKFSNNGGPFRHCVLSLECDQEAGMPPMQWLVIIDGELRRRYKDATLTLKLALVPKNGVNAFLQNMNARARLIKEIAVVDFRQENGDCIVDIRILNDEIGSAFGLSVNQDKRIYTLENFFGLSLEEIGLKLSYDQGNNDIIIASENTSGKFEIKSDLDNGDILLKHSQHYVYEAEGWRHSYTLSCDKINSDIGSSIKGGLRKVDANNDEDLISYEILMDNRAREPGEPIPNAIIKLTGNIFVDNELALAPDRKAGELKFSAEMKDYKLSSLDAAYNTINVGRINNGTLGFRYRPLDDTNEHSWNVYTKIEGQLNEVDVQFAASAELEGIFTSGKRLSSLTFTGEAKMGFNISDLEIGLGVSGKLQRIRMPERNTRYRIAGIGEIGFKKIKVIIEGGYGTFSSDRPQGDLSLNLTLGGIFEVILKLFQQDNEHRWEFPLD